MANFDVLDRKNCYLLPCPGWFEPLPYAECFEEALLTTLQLFA
eukprot:COSAG02_NODE_157_length_32999_cov_31.863647_12_plen_43_part_00